MNTLKILIKFRFLILSLAFLVTGLILKTIKDPDNIQLGEFKSFQTTLHENERKMEGLLLDLENKVVEDSINLINKKELFQTTYLDDFGFSFFVFENDTLIFWSDNAVPIDVIPEKEGLVHLLNGYYIVKKKQVTEKLSIVGLLIIKHDYSYQNEYINNDFHPAYAINPYFEIEADSDSGYPVYDLERNYLFSLSTDGSSLGAIYINYAISISYFISILAFLIFAVVVLGEIKKIRFRLLGIVVFGAVLIGFRFLLLEHRAPYIFYTLELFQPHLFATSYLLPSLGDLLLHSLFIFFFVFALHRHFDFVPFKIKLNNFLVLILICVLAVTLFSVTHHFFRSLILHSSINFEFHKVFDLSIYSLVGFVVIVLQLVTFLLFIDKIVLICKQIIKFKWFVIFSIVVVSLLSFILTQFLYEIEYYSVIFTVLIFIYMGYIRYRYAIFNYSTLILLLLLLAGFSEMFILRHSFQKEKEKQKVLVVNLANERDQIAEMLLEGVENQIQNDTVIKDLMTNYIQNEFTIKDYLEINYFTGYFRKYKLQISVCNPNDDLLLFLENNNTDFVHCYSFFNEWVNEVGLKLPTSRFYFLDNLDGQISYLGQFQYKKPEWEYEVSLFISLDSKLVKEELGYPDLLIDKKMSKSKVLRNYSYAKYRDNVLVNHSGSFSYRLMLPPEWKTSGEFLFTSEADFDHLVYQVDDDNYIVLSKSSLSYIDIFANFSYLFVFYYIILTLGLFVMKLPSNLLNFTYDFKNKIKFSIVGVLILSLIIVGAGTVIYSIKQFERKHTESIAEKIESVQVEIKHKLGGDQDLDDSYREYLTQLLGKFSYVFYIDINLYDENGELLASSRPMVFEKGLMGRKMNIEALHEMKIKNSRKFIHTEQIGNLVYYSAYMQFMNDNNELLAYINLPYFTRQSELRKETYTLVVALVNIYFFLILLSTIVAILISNNITKPLRMIQDRFRKIDLGKPHEPIHYQSRDEIGNLIQEYNRMGGELSANAVKLAKSERESAWREMAKQIAHEIKNPLTPMKLSVQYLERAWKDKTTDFDDRLERFSDSMIEQIDNLSSIATEFSNFAKMPKGTLEKLDLITKIKNSVDLFDKNEDNEFKVDYHGHKELFIMADKDQISIVLTNLIQNALQSIPKNEQGLIKVDADIKSGEVVLSICDNGSGIPEDVRGKLFQPNFTTKSGGMGMGLAIVKNIIDNCNGNIRYDTTVNEGTCFYVSFPFVSKKN